MSPSKIVQASATGDITTDTAHVRAVVLTAGSDAASVVVKAGGSGGTTVLTLKAAASTSVWAGLCEAHCSGGVHVTLTGTGPTVSVVFT